MNEITRQLSEADFAKQEARRHSPSKIANELEVSLRPFGQVQARHDLFMDQVKLSIARCQAAIAVGEVGVFSVDTISCPLYAFDSERGAGDFTAITGINQALDQSSRYRDKFDRYLVTLGQVAEVLKGRGITVQGRVHFGDAGVIGVEKLREQFGVETDADVRTHLAKNADAYKAYIEHDAVKAAYRLKGIPFVFDSLTSIAPMLEDMPLDLHEAAEASGIIKDPIYHPDIQERLKAIGVNDDTIRAILHEAEAIIITKLKGNFGLAREDIEKLVYQEAVGFLLAYGLVGQDMVRRTQKSDLLVALDPPRNYRNNLYYSFLESKGYGLAIFTPNTIDQNSKEVIQQKGDLNG